MYARWLVIFFFLLPVPLFAAEVDPAVPKSITQFQLLVDQKKLPAMEVQGVPYGGLSICKILAYTGPQPWIVDITYMRWFKETTTSDGKKTYALEPDECPTQGRWQVAYTGWSAMDLAKAQILSQPLEAQVFVQTYGSTKVIFLTKHYAVPVGQKPTPTAASEAAILKWLAALPKTLTIENAGRLLIPGDYAIYPSPVRR